jgi:uncharacterized damage-inducible protein DinB
MLLPPPIHPLRAPEKRAFAQRIHRATVASEMPGKRAPRGQSLMKTNRVSTAILFLALAAAPALRAQTIQAAYATDAGKLSDKFSGLASVMAARYDWKPGPGIRSVADVFNLIVAENGMLTRVLTGAAAPAAKPAPITDPAKLQEAIKASYAELQKTISGLSDADLKTSIKLFGRDMTKQDALMLLLEDQHEHLGQSIAYARTNSVVPPWSK